VYIRYVFLILILIFLPRRIPKTHIILAELLGEKNADFKIRYIFLIMIYIFLGCKIAKTYIIQAQIFGENNADFE
jgi:hypothetical protein